MVLSFFIVVLPIAIVLAPPKKLKWTIYTATSREYTKKSENMTSFNTELKD